MQNNGKITAIAIENLLDRNNLLKNTSGRFTNRELESLCTDSRKVRKESVFVCITGYVSDGHDYAEQAVFDGASLLITERKLPLNCPQLIVYSSRKAAALLAALFLDYPQNSFNLIGITGTNGKTTTANLLYQLLRNDGYKVGLIGTLGYSINGEDYESALTTPDILQLYEIFSQMARADVEYVVMEVSSHSLFLDRVYGLTFASALFTNLTQDHLDFHDNMEEYADAKFKLFSLLDDTGFAVINHDDLWGKKFFDHINDNKFSIGINSADYKIDILDESAGNTLFALTHSENSVKLRSPLTGKFNIYNLSLALVAYQHLRGVDLDLKIQEKINKLQAVRGRLERVTSPGTGGVFVDYAHTPDALENVLSTLKALNPSRLICVFGAGGDRDRSKRTLMYKAVANYADLIIITNDNPRTEDPTVIISDIISEIDNNKVNWIQPDRKVAIRSALSLAGSKDIVLIAGKGHEDYQIIGTKTIHFDDREEVLNYFKNPYQNEAGELAIPIHPYQLSYLLTGTISNNLFDQIHFVSTDSRNCQGHTIFFALQGENFDGHDFVTDILKHKNNIAVVKNNYPNQSEQIIKVDDPLKAYGNLARFYKRLFDIHIIAITGSVGKTTTKEYLSNILELKNSILKTSANENNLIGLPKTLFKIRADQRYAILELGSNQFGEIARLAEIAEAQTGIITNIGASHLEFFGDLDGVFKEKKALLDKPLINRVFPADSEYFTSYQGVSFGKSQQADFQYTDVETKSGETIFRVNGQFYRISTDYQTFVKNAVIAITTATLLHCDIEDIRAGLQLPLGVRQRMEIIHKRSRIILADCYNANPDSMKAAIKFWQKYKPEKPHIAILGDMLELGDKAEFYHQEIGEILQKIKGISVYAVGPLSINYHTAEHYKIIDQLLESPVDKDIPSDAVILVKASHGIKLEKIIGRL